MRRLGILGCGAIGSELARFAESEDRIEAVRVFDVDTDRAERLAESCPKAAVVGSVDTLADECELVCEAASQEAAREHLVSIVEAGVDVVMLSLGALADDEFRDALRSAAEGSGAKVHLPSGAIAAVDGLKAGNLGGLRSVTLVTTKPPAALGVDVNQWTVLFDGTAREAVRNYPQNVNVAACLAVSGLGFDRTRVQVVADPLAQRNEHKVIFEGDFGRVRCMVENVPSPGNPKTSWLAALSAMATVQRILDPFQVGT